jgi:hypothetical protein
MAGTVVAVSDGYRWRNGVTPVQSGAAGSPIMRVVKNAKNNKPLDIRKLFTREISREDQGLPSDDFIGYEQDPVLRLLGIIFDVGVQCRTISLILRARMR